MVNTLKNKTTSYSGKVKGKLAWLTIMTNKREGFGTSEVTLFLEELRYTDFKLLDSVMDAIYES